MNQRQAPQGIFLIFRKILTVGHGYCGVVIGDDSELNSGDVALWLHGDVFRSTELGQRRAAEMKLDRHCGQNVKQRHAL
jgi:hypothetical protein